MIIAPKGRGMLPWPEPTRRFFLHVVFSTKHRRNVITPEMQPRLYDYIGGIIRAENGVLYAIAGMADHLHLLLRLGTDRAIADLMRTVKARSSLWVHKTFPSAAAFAWQQGYSVFSVSKSAEPDVKSYIENQAEHHKKRGFQDELLALLNLHAIEFDGRHVFD